jgi:hypothetical protein
LEDEPAPLAKRDDFFHQRRRFFAVRLIRHGNGGLWRNARVKSRRGAGR